MLPFMTVKISTSAPTINNAAATVTTTLVSAALGLSPLSENSTASVVFCESAGRKI